MDARSWQVWFGLLSRIRATSRSPAPRAIAVHGPLRDVPGGKKCRAVAVVLRLTYKKASSPFLEKRTKKLLSVCVATARTKVFCFFFAKKKALPLL